MLVHMGKQSEARDSMAVFSDCTPSRPPAALKGLQDLLMYRAINVLHTPSQRSRQTSAHEYQLHCLGAVTSAAPSKGLQSACSLLMHVGVPGSAIAHQCQVSKLAVPASAVRPIHPCTLSLHCPVLWLERVTCSPAS